MQWPQGATLTARSRLQRRPRHSRTADSAIAVASVGSPSKDGQARGRRRCSLNGRDRRALGHGPLGANYDFDGFVPGVLKFFTSSSCPDCKSFFNLSLPPVSP